MIVNGRSYHIALKVGDVGKYVILPGDPARCKMIAKYFESPVLVGSNREYVIYTGYLSGVKVSVCSTGIGGPSASIAVEELIELGADTFIRVGTCGGMSKKVHGGDCIIVTGAIRNEGTSREYAPIEFPAVSDFTVTKTLELSAKELNFPHHIGVVHNKDSFYGQHDPSSMPVGYDLKNKWDAYIKLGALASEMESAAIFTVCAARGARAGGVMYTVWNQEEDENYTGTLNTDTDSAIKIAVEAIKKLITIDKED